MAEFEIKFFDKKKINDKFEEYVLGIDIGGTNTNLCIAGVKEKKPVFLYSLNFHTENLNSIIPAVKKTLDFSIKKYNIKIEKACIGAPGIVSSDNKSADLTNISWNVKSDEIIDNTALRSVYILNDFQIIGYGLNFLKNDKKEDILTIKKGEKTKNQTKAIIGPGTGFGKTILSFNKENDLYLPLKSEGGHADFPIRNSYELELTKFVKDFRKIKNPITYEELLSGRGIKNIYYFLRSKNKEENSQISKEIDNSKEKAELISKYKDKDIICSETFKLFTKFLSRSLKNFSHKTMATGGLYIAGGIASKNKEIFRKDYFLNEFENAYKRSDVLKNIPIYLIKNYDVSIFGACLCAILEM